MKVAVYDRYWPTAGGGERYAAGVAAALSETHDVVLFAHTDIDLDALSERLHVDLSSVSVEVVGAEPRDVEAASSTVDLFVNASYTSRVHNRAEHGVYIVHFPGPSVAFPAWAQPLVWLGQRLVPDDGIDIDYGTGFHEPEWLLQRQGSWTAGDASLSLSLPKGSHSVTLDLARMPPGRRDRVGLQVAIVQEGRQIASESTIVLPPAHRWSKRVQSLTLGVESTGDEPVQVRLRADAVQVSSRQLGVAVVGVRVGSGIRARIRGAYPMPAGRRRWSGFTADYDKIVANSEFTRGHVEQRWNCVATVLEPPVTMHSPAEKRSMILTVGRFFPGSAGHSKKQVEMVNAFRRLCENGVEGWEFHLVGGVDSQGIAYLDEVRGAGKGLPVHVHENATGAELAELYGAASIYWHAAGWGEDPARHPDRLEHFGISTVEAMSAGAVPVVLAAGGLLETVSHGKTGMHWHTEKDLVAQTSELINDPTRRAAMSKAAGQAAKQWSADEFKYRINKLVNDLSQ